MTVRVLFFASLRERAGRAELAREIGGGTTAGALLEALRRDFPALEGSGRLAIAVNSEYADPERVLRDGDEVALIPPVSGGRGEGRGDGRPAGAAGRGALRGSPFP